jgi:hypothetical protein
MARMGVVWEIHVIPERGGVDEMMEMRGGG